MAHLRTAPPRRGMYICHSAETKYYPVKGFPHLTPAERCVATHGNAFKAIGMAAFPEKVVSKPKCSVMVSHGRWIVRCPFCPGAQYASKEDHRALCVYCDNLDVGGAWLKVIWPENWKEIEIALFRRPKMQYRNWLPGETLDDLAKQDAEAIGLANATILSEDIG